METIPQKRIKSQADLESLHKGEILKEYIGFVVELQKSIRGKGISQTERLAEFSIYDDYQKQVRQVLKDTPPKEGKMRFGNLAFKEFHAKLVDVNKDFSERLVKSLGADPIYSIELATYLNESYGNEVRIDYGTGHELNFMVFLYCVNQIHPFKKETYEAVVHQIFYDYIYTMREIQLTYNLEPAGSHGVWGLDDYHFLPFIFGGAELIDNPMIKSPLDIHKESLLEEYKDEYMYLDCIAFIKKIKKSVPFGESSPMLNDISAAASWEKVAMGMVKMYNVEVLSKFPVMQHLRFGKLFPFK